MYKITSIVPLATLVKTTVEIIMEMVIIVLILPGVVFVLLSP